MNTIWHTFGDRQVRIHHVATRHLQPALCSLLCLLVLAAPSLAEETPSAGTDSSDIENLAKQVTIYRDAWGVPHVHGKTDAAMVFGMGYVQCEDYFWQLEDNCIRSLGRYSEIAGKSGLKEDVLNRVFEIPRRSKEDYEKLSDEYRLMMQAFVDGINFYLKKHPQTKVRLLKHWEPHWVLAMDRWLLLKFVYGKSHFGRSNPASFEATVQAATGSNQWAIGPSKTKAGSTMLFINPHQPWYGAGQFYEVHVMSDEGINFSGACFYGSPIPSLGFNEHLGWAYTVNEPDIADTFEVTFDDPGEPLHYRFDGKHRKADEWRDTIKVKKGREVDKREFVFRKTHHGPIVRLEQDGKVGYSVRIGRLFDLNRVTQATDMVKATSFDEWKQAFSLCAIPMFNASYADKDGNILYVYNGSIPKRDPNRDWTKVVDGSTSDTAWNGFLQFHELPQVLNPPSGYVQNCNSSPFYTTDEGNPARGDFPAYIMEDGEDDKRRAKMCRKLLREASEVTFEQMKTMAFDTTLYWPLVQLPQFKRDFARLQRQAPPRAEKVKAYLDHLLDWDCRVSAGSTQASLCEAWYTELYGEGYPAERLKDEFRLDRFKQLDALVTAAKKMKQMHGDWKVQWGEIHRLQRTVKKPGVMEAAVAMNDLFKSYPSLGAPGPMGIVFTAYSTPSIRFLRKRKYNVVGASYLGVIEFGKDKVQAASLTPYGQSSDPRSEHYFDQAKLLSEQKLKTAWLYLDDVKKNAEEKYRLVEPQ